MLVLFIFGLWLDVTVFVLHDPGLGLKSFVILLGYCLIRAVIQYYATLKDERIYENPDWDFSDFGPGPWNANH